LFNIRIVLCETRALYENSVLRRQSSFCYELLYLETTFVTYPSFKHSTTVN